MVQVAKVNTAENKEGWVKWLETFGARRFLDAFMETAHGAESLCVYCHEPIYLDLLEGGGVADWRTQDGDYGCGDSPDTTDEGTGSHKARGTKGEAEEVS